MTLAATTLSTRSISFTLTNPVTIARTRRALHPFFESIVSLSQFHLLERIILPDFVLSVLQRALSLNRVPESLVAAKLVLLGLSLVKPSLTLLLAETNCKRKFSCTCTMLFFHALKTHILL